MYCVGYSVYVKCQCLNIFRASVFLMVLSFTKDQIRQTFIWLVGMVWLDAVVVSVLCQMFGVVVGPV